MTEPTDNNPQLDGETGAPSPIEDRLSAHFRGEAELIPTAESLERPTSLNAVRQRAERRRSRRQAGVGIAAAACIAVVGFGALQLSNDDQQNDVAAVETTTTIPGADEATDDSTEASPVDSEPELIDALLANGGPKLAWEAVEGLPDDVVSYSIAATPEAFFTIGALNGLTTVYRSTDGRVWEPIAEDLELAAYRVQASDGVLLLEGGPSALSDDFGGPFSPEFLVSRDGGQTWSTLDLPETAALDVPVGGIAIEQSSTVQVAAAGEALVAVQSSFLFTDVQLLLAENGINSADWEVVDNGILFFEEGVGQGDDFVAFSELSAFADTDLTDAEIADLLGSEQTATNVFRSIDDGPFEPVDIGVELDAEFASITSVDGAAVLQIFGPQSQAFRSTDGVTWTAIETEVEIFSPGAGGQSLLGFSPNGLLESVDGGQTWAAIDVLPELSPMQLLRSDLGVTVISSPGMGAPSSIAIPDIEVTKDNLTFSVSFDDGADGDVRLVDNETGEVLRFIAADELDPETQNGPGLIWDEEAESVSLYSLDTDELLITITLDDLLAASPDVATTGIEEFLIGHSLGDDDFGWIKTSDLVDSPDAFPMLAATDDVIIVSFEGPNGADLFVANRVAE